MASRLIETVSINLEDFNENFLTCSTCLNEYNADDRCPKLLPCSHTVCRTCLQRIIEIHDVNSIATGAPDEASFKCPICRETIPVPRGGVVAFPPSFIVNQLIDLMSQQRRDVVPKCSVHRSQELFFCETCDSVFCWVCNGGSHNTPNNPPNYVSCGNSSEHTVISLSIAIKRMTDILLFKAQLCMRNLDKAHEVVSSEIQKLETHTEKTIEQINESFQKLLQLMDNRHRDLVRSVEAIRDEKRQVLLEQLAMIQTERDSITTECQGLEYQVEVRNISKKISDLNEKLDAMSNLGEPRENAYIKFIPSLEEEEECEIMTSSHSQTTLQLNAPTRDSGYSESPTPSSDRLDPATKQFKIALEQFGSIQVSTTFPALCLVHLPQPPFSL